MNSGSCWFGFSPEGFLAALLMLAFALLAGEVLDGDTRAFDMALLHAAQTLRAGRSAVMRDVSGLGNSAVLTLFTVMTVAYLALASTRDRAGLVAASAISGALCVGVFKAAFGRARPEPSRCTASSAGRPSVACTAVSQAATPRKQARAWAIAAHRVGAG